MVQKTVDLVIHNGALVSPTMIVEQSLAIDNGVIVAIGPSAEMPPARDTIDASGLHVLPGAIDVHVHFREPGFSHKETWTTATHAAAVGGITTVFDMPNTNPPTANVAALQQKLDLAGRQANDDFGIYAVIVETNIEELRPMAKAGAVSFKLYMEKVRTLWSLPARPTAPSSTLLRSWQTLACAARCMPKALRS